MTMKFFSAGIAMAALLALAACKSEGTGGAGGGTGGTGGTGGSGGTAGGGGTTGGGGTGGTAPSCYDCACASDSPCKSVCDDMGVDANGNPKLNFCTNGMTNGSQCGSCVATNCDGVALADCTQ
jgi:hypothetical protein